MLVIKARPPAPSRAPAILFFAAFGESAIIQPPPPAPVVFRSERPRSPCREHDLRQGWMPDSDRVEKGVVRVHQSFPRALGSSRLRTPSIVRAPIASRTGQITLVGPPAPRPRTQPGARCCARPGYYRQQVQVHRRQPPPRSIHDQDDAAHGRDVGVGRRRPPLLDGLLDLVRNRGDLLAVESEVELVVRGRQGRDGHCGRRPEPRRRRHLARDVDRTRHVELPEAPVDDGDLAGAGWRWRRTETRMRGLIAIASPGLS